MATGCSVVAVGILLCRFFNPLEVLPQSRYTLGAREVQMDEDVAGGAVILHYDEAIWPLLRNLWSGQNHYNCRNGICTIAYEDYGFDVDVISIEYTTITTTKRIIHHSTKRTIHNSSKELSDVAIVLMFFGSVMTVTFLSCMCICMDCGRRCARRWSRWRHAEEYDLGGGEESMMDRMKMVWQARYDCKNDVVTLEKVDPNPSSLLMDLSPPKFTPPTDLTPSRCAPPFGTPLAPVRPPNTPLHPIHSSTPDSALPSFSRLCAMTISNIPRSDIDTPVSLKSENFNMADTVQHGEQSSTWTAMEGSQDCEIVMKNVDI